VRTYQALQVTKPGTLEPVERSIIEPASGQVRIRVEACGVCHSDSATVDGIFPVITYPRVPGHEVVGRIDALGSGVQGWAVGQRVGVGFLGGYCGYCEFCRNGDLVNCRNQKYTGIHHDGGYVEVMIAKASGLVSIPNDLSSVDAARAARLQHRSFGWDGNRAVRDSTSRVLGILVPTKRRMLGLREDGTSIPDPLIVSLDLSEVELARGNSKMFQEFRGGTIMDSFQELFDQQKRHFASGITSSYEWRVEQLEPVNRLSRIQ